MEFFRRSSKRRDNRVPPSDIVKRSIKRSWTISNPTGYSSRRGSPELRSYNSLVYTSTPSNHNLQTRESNPDSADDENVPCEPVNRYNTLTTESNHILYPHSASRQPLMPLRSVSMSEADRISRKPWRKREEKNMGGRKRDKMSPVAQQFQSDMSSLPVTPSRRRRSSSIMLSSDEDGDSVPSFHITTENNIAVNGEEIRRLSQKQNTGLSGSKNKEYAVRGGRRRNHSEGDRIPHGIQVEVVDVNKTDIIPPPRKKSPGRLSRRSSESFKDNLLDSSSPKIYRRYSSFNQRKTHHVMDSDIVDCAINSVPNSALSVTDDFKSGGAIDMIVVKDIIVKEEEPRSYSTRHDDTKGKEYDIEPLSGAVFRKVAVKKRRKESHRKGGSNTTDNRDLKTSERLSPLSSQSPRKKTTKDFVSNKVKRIFAHENVDETGITDNKCFSSDVSNLKSMPYAPNVFHIPIRIEGREDEFQTEIHWSQEVSSSENTKISPNISFTERESPDSLTSRQNDMSLYTTQCASDTTSEICLDPSKIAPECEHYKLVFISSDSSKESDLSLEGSFDSSDQSGPPSRCVSSMKSDENESSAIDISVGGFIDESDWDYYVGGESSGRNSKLSVNSKLCNSPHTFLIDDEISHRTTPTNVAPVPSIRPRSRLSRYDFENSEEQYNRVKTIPIVVEGTKNELSLPTTPYSIVDTIVPRNHEEKNYNTEKLFTKYSLSLEKNCNKSHRVQRAKSFHQYDRRDSSNIGEHYSRNRFFSRSDSARSSGERSLEEISFTDHLLPAVVIETDLSGSRSRSESDLQAAFPSFSPPPNTNVVPADSTPDKIPPGCIVAVRCGGRSKQKSDYSKTRSFDVPQNLQEADVVKQTVEANDSFFPIRDFYTLPHPKKSRLIKNTSKHFNQGTWPRHKKIKTKNTVGSEKPNKWLETALKGEFGTRVRNFVRAFEGATGDIATDIKESNDECIPSLLKPEYECAIITDTEVLTINNDNEEEINNCDKSGEYSLEIVQIQDRYEDSVIFVDFGEVNDCINEVVVNACSSLESLSSEEYGISNLFCEDFRTSVMTQEDQAIKVLSCNTIVVDSNEKLDKGAINSHITDVSHGYPSLLEEVGSISDVKLALCDNSSGEEDILECISSLFCNSIDISTHKDNSRDNSDTEIENEISLSDKKTKSTTLVTLDPCANTAGNVSEIKINLQNIFDNSELDSVDKITYSQEEFNIFSVFPQSDYQNVCSNVLEKSVANCNSIKQTASNSIDIIECRTRSDNNELNIACEQNFELRSHINIENATTSSPVSDYIMKIENISERTLKSTENSIDDLPSLISLQEVNEYKTESLTIKVEDRNIDDEPTIEYSVELGQITHRKKRQIKNKRDSCTSSSESISDIDELPECVSGSLFLECEIGLDSDSQDSSTSSSTDSEKHVRKSYQIICDDDNDTSSSEHNEQEQTSDSLTTSALVSYNNEEFHSSKVFYEKRANFSTTCCAVETSVKCISKESEVKDDPVLCLQAGSGTEEGTRERVESPSWQGGLSVEEKHGLQPIEYGSPVDSIEVCTAIDDAAVAVEREVSDQENEVITTVYSDVNCAIEENTEQVCSVVNSNEYSDDVVLEETIVNLKENNSETVSTIESGVSSSKNLRSRFHITRALTPDLNVLYDCSSKIKRDSDGPSSGEETRLESDTDSQDTIIEGPAFQKLKHFAFKQKIATTCQEECFESSTSQYDRDYTHNSTDCNLQNSVFSPKRNNNRPSSLYTSCVQITQDLLKENVKSEGSDSVRDLRNVSVIAITDKNSVNIVSNSSTVIRDRNVSLETQCDNEVIVHHTNIELKTTDVHKLAGHSEKYNFELCSSQEKDDYDNHFDLANYFSGLETGSAIRKKQPIMHRNPQLIGLNLKQREKSFHQDSNDSWKNSSDFKTQSTHNSVEEDNVEITEIEEVLWTPGDDSDSHSVEEVESVYSESSSDEAYFDREEDLRGYNRSIDFTLHTILEESEEEQEEKPLLRNQKPNLLDQSQLEKYFVFELGGGENISNNGSHDDPSRNSKFANEESEYSDAFSETSSSIYSLESADKSAEDEDLETDPVDLASSRLEKYFLTGFLGLDPLAPLQSNNDATLSDGQPSEDGSGEESVGSDSEGQPSPERPRRKVTHRARGQWSGRVSFENINDPFHDNDGGDSPAIRSTKTSSASGGDLSDNTSDATDASDIAMAFEKAEGQFDTIKRRKKKHRSGGGSNNDTTERKSDSEKGESVEISSTSTSNVLFAIQSTTENDIRDSDPEGASSATPVPETTCQTTLRDSEYDVPLSPSSPFPSETMPPFEEKSSFSVHDDEERTNSTDSSSKQQSRDSGFIGSCDDLLSDSSPHVTSPVDNCKTYSSNTVSDLDCIEKELLDEKDDIGNTEDLDTSDIPSAKTSKENEHQEKAETRSLVRSDSKKSSRSSSIGSADSNFSLSYPRGGKLTRKDSFNNWSSDEETNLMMTKVRAFFKNMVIGVGNKPVGETKPTKIKPPQLVHFENELTRLMRTVPGINDEQVREIVEYLSSEDTWSDSYDSSDYTSSDLEGAYAFDPFIVNAAFPTLKPVPELQEQISASCQQIIHKFEKSNLSYQHESTANNERNLREMGDTTFAYQKLLLSLNRAEISSDFPTSNTSGVSLDKPEGSGQHTPPQPTSNSPPLFSKVIQHIGTRLVALMHEVSFNNDTQSLESKDEQQQPLKDQKQLFEPITSSPKTGPPVRLRKSRKNDVMITEVSRNMLSLRNNLDSDESPTEADQSPESDEMHTPKGMKKDYLHRDNDTALSNECIRLSSLLGSGVTKTGRAGPATRIPCVDVSRSLSHESGMWQRLCLEEKRETKESLQSSSSGASEIAEEREDDYFSWKGSFESALAADSRTKLSLEAKRRSGGSDYTRGSGSTSDLCSSSDQLDRAGRVKSCGNIHTGSKSSLQLWSEKEAARARPNVVGSSDLISYTGSSSRCGERGTDDSDQKSWQYPGYISLYGRRRSVPDTVARLLEDESSIISEGTGSEPRSVTLPRSNTIVSASTNSLPRLPYSGPQQSHSNSAPSTMQKSQTLVMSDYSLNSSGIVRSARYRPPGYKQPPCSASLSKRAMSAPGVAFLPSRNKGRRKLSQEESSTIFSSHASPALSSGALSPASSSPRIGGSNCPSPLLSPGTHYHPHSHNTLGRRSICSVAASDWSGPDEDIDGLVAQHQQRSSTTSLGTRSDSMVSVYSAAGEGRYGTVPVKGEVEFGLQYNYKQGALVIQVKQCKELAAVDAKRNRSDPYVKVYLLPDKSKSGKRKTKVKKHTLNPVFDETLKFQVALSELETRTLWLTVWHSDMFGRNDFLGEVMMPLAHKVFDDASPKWYPLQERLEPLDDLLSYKGDIIVALKFVPPSTSTQKKNKRSKGTLYVLVKEAKNLTPVKVNGSSDPFCKSYLLPDKGKNTKQKTAVVKRTCNPEWHHTFSYEDVSLEELHERALELTVWDHDRLTSNEFLGGVRFNLGTGKHQGKATEWMDATEKESALWQSMLDRPNFWVEGSLMLRPTMEHRVGS